MKLTITIIQTAVRLLAVVLIVLGFLFWTGHEFNLVSVHMRLGVTLVLLLWILCVFAVRARVKPGLIVVAFLWGLLTAGFGMSMGRMLPGPAHEVIRVLHFLIGLGALGLAEALAARSKRRIASIDPRR